MALVCLRDVYYTDNMSKFFRFLIILEILLLCPFVIGAKEAGECLRTPFSSLLEQQIQKKELVRQNPGMGRLPFMRFYFPNNNVQEKPGFWDRFEGCDTDVLIRAYAIYLYNMYISAAAYQEDIPSALTVDYLGVLDGFSRCANGFHAEKSVSFYRKHRPEIQAILKQFFAQHHLPVYQENNSVNEKRDEAFLNVLEKTFKVGGKNPAYRVLGKTRLEGTPSEEDRVLLENLLKRSLAIGNNQVIYFEQREAFGPELDTPLAHREARTQTTCRQVNDECAACSYFFGREMCQTIASKHRNWGFSRLYQITARPMKSGLKSSSGTDYFILANGQRSEAWDYHTATLVILNLDGKYTPYIVDKFLAGQKPISPNAWFKKFATSQTAFVITPYQRKKEIEERFEVKSK